MVKKFWKIATAFSFFVLCACSSTQQTKQIPERNRIKVVSTIAQIGDLVAEIGGNRIESSVLVRGELNPHAYELVKGDDEKMQGAQCIFYNGLGLEHGASVAAGLASHPHAFAVGEAIQKQHPEKILWRGKVPDPHIWMDVSLWAETAEPIAKELASIDPEGAPEYYERALRIKEKMNNADQQFRSKLHQIPAEQRYLVTSHDAFQYFTRRYLAEEGESAWEARFAAPEGLSPEGQLNPVDLQKIVEHLGQYRIEILFPESNVSRDSIRKIASAASKLGLDVRICKQPLYGDSFRGGYLEAMSSNAEVIFQSLSE